MLNDLTILERALADLMSDLSEKCYYAGWMEHLEYVLWDAVINGERRYGREVIDLSDIKRLKELSDACGGWIYFDDNTEETAIPLPMWQTMYAEKIDSMPEVLKS